MTSPRTVLALITAMALALTGCGDSDSSSTSRAKVAFPRVGDLTLEQLATRYSQGPIVAPSTSVIERRNGRFAFGLFTVDHRPATVGAAAVYLSCRGSRRTYGPSLARRESLAVRPQFRSKTSSLDVDLAQSVYVARIGSHGDGPCRVLTLVERGGRLRAADLVEVSVADPKSGPPAVGDRAIKVHTPTKASVGGDLSKIDTRVPPDTMHEVDVADALGKRPVVLVFATPALCQSRVCGPVVDIAEQVKAKFGDRVAFIHMEIFKDNEVNKGYRPQVGAWKLPSEPWVFVIGRDGRIKDRFEGAVSVRELSAAVSHVD